MEERREELVRFKSNFAGTDVCMRGGGRKIGEGGDMRFLLFYDFLESLLENWCSPGKKHIWLRKPRHRINIYSFIYVQIFICSNPYLRRINLSKRNFISE